MSASSCSTLRRNALAAASITAVLTLGLAACGSSDRSSTPAMKHHAESTAGTSAGAMPSMSDMPGMESATADSGLADTKDGYRLTSPNTTLPADRPTSYQFAITGPDGRPVTDFAVEQTKQMHFYAIRSDLTGFQHVHPTMTASGTWTAELASLAPGSWRLFATFNPTSEARSGKDFVLSRVVTVPGAPTTTPLPAPATSTNIDGYTVTLTGTPMVGMAHPLTVTIDKDGKPVTDLQPYLDTYAHLTAFHQGDLAFAHLHPATTLDGGHGEHGGPTLPFHAELPTAGDWRLFLQFQTAGKLHTGPLTLHVR